MNKSASNTNIKGFSDLVYIEVEKRFSGESIDWFLPSDFSYEKDSVSILDEIAKGAFGTVHKAMVNNELKVVKIQEFPDDIQEEVNLLTELTILQSFPNERLVNFFGAYSFKIINKNQILMVLEYYRNGDLKECLKYNSIMPWNLKVRLCLDISKGISFLHDQGIIHRDIKSANVVIDESWRALLCDFSFCCHRNGESNLDFTYGTPEYMSPEMALAMKFDLSTDVFSFGITLCEVICGRSASDTFLSRNPRTLFALDEAEVRRSLPVDCPEGLVSLALRCCDALPEERPSIVCCQQLLQDILERLGGEDFPFAVPDPEPVAGLQNQTLEGRVAQLEEQLTRMQTENSRLASDFQALAALCSSRTSVPSTQAGHRRRLHSSPSLGASIDPSVFGALWSGIGGTKPHRGPDPCLLARLAALEHRLDTQPLHSLSPLPAVVPLPTVRSVGTNTEAEDVNGPLLVQVQQLQQQVADIAQLLVVRSTAATPAASPQKHSTRVGEQKRLLTRKDLSSALGSFLEAVNHCNTASEPTADPPSLNGSSGGGTDQHRLFPSAQPDVAPWPDQPPPSRLGLPQPALPGPPAAAFFREPRKQPNRGRFMSMPSTYSMNGDNSKNQSFLTPISGTATQDQAVSSYTQPVSPFAPLANRLQPFSSSRPSNSIASQQPFDRTFR